VALILGFLLLYGNFRTTNLGRIGAILDARLDKGVAYAGLTEWHALLALIFVAVGVFLLTDAAPLHVTVPNLYEFAPTPVAGFLGAAAKVAGFAFLLRLFSFLFLFAHEKWMHVWGGAAILSLLWGNLAAIRQKNILRLLAYGSVAQTGFTLVALVAANEAGFTGMAYSIATLVFATVGAFGVVIVLRGSGARATELRDLRGLLQKSPVAAWLLLFFALALAGVPPTGGFIAKYYLVKGLLARPHPELAAFTVVNAVLAAFAYSRIAAHAFKKAPVDAGTDEPQTMPIIFSNAETVALTAAAFVSLVAGLYPAPFLRVIGYVFGQ
jgi:NADH-quinone oxidoreductase subunit N